MWKERPRGEERRRNGKRMHGPAASGKRQYCTPAIHGPKRRTDVANRAKEKEKKKEEETLSRALSGYKIKTARRRNGSS